MSPHLFSHPSFHYLPAGKRRDGAALIIVLAFVVLLTGLVVAFFSRAILQRQISNSSASQTKAEFLAQGATDQIIGDLKQEIADPTNSNLSTPATGVTIYIPKTAANVVPALVGSTGTGGLQNLLKRSVYNTTFYSGSAINRAAGPNPNPSPASSPQGTTTNVSLNGRSVSPARWNKALLLQKATAPTSSNSWAVDTNDTDYTPVNTGANTFIAPDWILVGRDGSNPTAFAAGTTNNPTSANYPVGRYAYTIYDEGGLLDVNVAGYPLGAAPGSGTALYIPITPTPGPSPSPTPTPGLPGNSDPKAAYKNALAFADLSQIPGIGPYPASTPGLTLTRQQGVINSIVGWRNYASTQPTGSLTSGSAGFNFAPAPTPAPPALSPALINFTNLIMGNTNGFLKTANTLPLSSTGNQSDRMLTSRQQLIKLLIQGIATGGQSAASKTERANLQNALQYLGTFSRDLNQPSFIPPTSFTTNPKPVSVVAASGGNDALNLGGDTKINPSYLATRVSTAFTRNNGSQAAPGDPLVKSRFALSRLAWLTFKGPIADDNGNLNPTSDTDIQTVITQLQGQGVSTQLLKQGGPANIQKYFGLSWVVDSSNSIGLGDGTSKWKYLHGSSGNKAAIQRLDQITGREPDFFELLKSAVTAGAIAKGAGVLNVFSSGQYVTVDPATSTFQNSRDTSIDASIIQLGANIINQASVDGYSRRILFDDGSYSVPQEYHGIVDLPYIYRLRGGHFKLHEATPAVDANLTPQAGPITDFGLGAFLVEPEIWNPHTWSPTAVAAIPASLRPSNFRLVAISQQPGNYASLSSTKATIQARNADMNTIDSFYPSNPNEPQPVTLTESNTELDFNIPTGRADLFREPTLLIKPNVPTGSNLHAGTGHLLRTDPTITAYVDSATSYSAPAASSSGPGTSTGAVKSYYTSAAYLTQSPVVPDNQLYLGIYFGSFPLWVLDTAHTAPLGSYAASSRATFQNQTDFLYRLEYQDPANSGKWDVYDEKFAPLCFMNRSGTAEQLFGIGAAAAQAGEMIGLQNFSVYCDPRTARFCTMPMSSTNTAHFYDPPPSIPFNGWAGWANASQNAVFSARVDEYPGDPGIVTPGTALGFYNYSTAPSSNMVSFGWYMQNDPNLPTSGGMCNYSGANGQGGTSGQGGAPGPEYYTDPDGIVRRAMGAHITPSATLPATPNTVPSGIPSRQGATTYALNAGIIVGSPSTEGPSRPMILNRPFRSVGELGYVFSGMPWKNISFFTPESGYAALLDVFCINDTDNVNALVAGKVNLNTRQSPVLKAILSGSYTDEATAAAGLTAAQADALLTDATNGLMARTSSVTPPKGPLQNVSELVGKWVSSVNAASGGIDGKKSSDGYSEDLGNISVISSSNSLKNSQRYRESTIRGLAATGQTRVWNLMIDVIAQTGRYPLSATTLANFNVEGEQRYWVHVAIDRYTGQILDKQIEVVKE